MSIHQQEQNPRVYLELIERHFQQVIQTPPGSLSTNPLEALRRPKKEKRKPLTALQEEAFGILKMLCSIQKEEENGKKQCFRLTKFLLMDFIDSQRLFSAPEKKLADELIVSIASFYRLRNKYEIIRNIVRKTLPGKNEKSFQLDFSKLNQKEQLILAQKGDGFLRYVVMRANKKLLAQPGTPNFASRYRARKLFIDSGLTDDLRGSFPLPSFVKDPSNT